jgi:hypothetical protein
MVCPDRATLSRDRHRRRGVNSGMMFAPNCLASLNEIELERISLPQETEDLKGLRILRSNGRVLLSYITFRISR